MDVLRNLFGNLTAGIIRLLVTVGILAAAYFFIVKPTLETTEKVSHETNVNIQKGFESSDFNELGDVNKQIEDVNRRVQREVRRSAIRPEHRDYPPDRGQGHREADPPALADLVPDGAGKACFGP